MSAIVSVIIPVYNSKKYLQESVNSVLDQTYSPIEIILVNDGSTDGTEELFYELERQGIICVSQVNQGASTARNTGLAIAKGEYIQFLDADDLLHPTKIEKQVNLMIKENADLSFTFWDTFTGDRDYSKDSFLKQRFSQLDFSDIHTGKDIMRSYGKNDWDIAVHSWLIKRELINKAGFWNSNLSYHDDGEFFSRVLFWSNKVSIIKEHLAYYRKTSEATISVLSTQKKVYSALNSWKLVLALILSVNDKTLLAYPKRGFYLMFIKVRRQFPAMAKQFATELEH